MYNNGSNGLNKDSNNIDHNKGLDLPRDEKKKVNKPPISHIKKKKDSMKGEYINTGQNTQNSRLKHENEESKYLSLIFKSQDETKKVLNTFISDFLEKSGMSETAINFKLENKNKLLKPFDTPSNSEEEKILEAFKIKRSFLNEWWQIFWDVFNVKAHKNGSKIAQEYYSFNASRQNLEFLCRQASMKAAFEQQMSERRGDYQMEAMHQHSSMSQSTIPSQMKEQGTAPPSASQNASQHNFQKNFQNNFHAAPQQQPPPQFYPNIQPNKFDQPPPTQQQPSESTQENKQHTMQELQKKQILHIQQQQMQQIQQLQQQMQHHGQQSQQNNQQSQQNNQQHNQQSQQHSQQLQQDYLHSQSATGENQANANKLNNLTTQQMVQQRIAKISPMVPTEYNNNINYQASVSNLNVPPMGNMNIDNSQIYNNGKSHNSNLNGFPDQTESFEKDLGSNNDNIYNDLGKHNET